MGDCNDRRGIVSMEERLGFTITTTGPGEVTVSGFRRYIRIESLVVQTPWDSWPD